MSLNSNAIVTLADAMEQMKVVTLSTVEQTAFENYINDASSAVELYCKKKFVSQSISNEIQDGDGRNIIYPQYSPFIQLSTATTPTDADKLAAVQYRTSPDDSWTDICTDVDHIFIDTNSDSVRPYIELYNAYFLAGRRNIRLNYKAGYATVPTDIKIVVLEMIQMRWNEAKRGNDWLGQGNVNTSQIGNSYSTTIISLDKRWKTILDRYRVPSLG